MDNGQFLLPLHICWAIDRYLVNLSTVNSVRIDNSQLKIVIIFAVSVLRNQFGHLVNTCGKSNSQKHPKHIASSQPNSKLLWPKQKWNRLRPFFCYICTNSLDAATEECIFFFRFESIWCMNACWCSLWNVLSLL